MKSIYYKIQFLLNISDMTIYHIEISKRIQENVIYFSSQKFATNIIDKVI